MTAHVIVSARRKHKTNQYALNYADDSWTAGRLPLTLGTFELVKPELPNLADRRASHCRQSGSTPRGGHWKRPPYPFRTTLWSNAQRYTTRNLLTLT